MKKTQNSMKTALLAILVFICGTALANAGTETYSWETCNLISMESPYTPTRTSLIRGD